VIPAMLQKQNSQMLVLIGDPLLEK